MNNQVPGSFEKQSFSPEKHDRMLQFGKKTKTKSAQRLFCTLFTLLFFVFLNSCVDHTHVALTTDDIQDGKFAVNQLTNQTTLTKIALEASHPHVRRYAVEKITNQSLLVKIAIESDSYVVCNAAVEKITDHAALEKIATKTANVLAVEKLTNPVMLVNFVDHENFNVRKAAIKKLITPEMLDSLGHIKDNQRVDAAYTFLGAFDNVPEKHRLRIVLRILPSFCVLNDSEVTDVVGEIIDAKVSWSYRSASYHGALSGTVGGESVSCKIKLRNLSQPLFQQWTTQFPQTVSTLTFRNAPIKNAELLDPVFDRLPESVLERFIEEEKFETIQRDVRTKLKSIRNKK